MREEVLGRAASLLPARRPGDLTAALMDLGIGRARHTVVIRRLEIALYRARATGGNGAGEAATRWFRPAELAVAAIPTLTRKIAEAVGRSSKSG